MSTNVKVDWFAESQIPNNSITVTIDDVSDIMDQAEYHPAQARRRMMKQIDISLDNKDKEEFYILSGLLLTIK